MTIPTTVKPNSRFQPRLLATLVTTAVVSVAGTTSISVSAQEENAKKSGVLEEVVVSARKRGDESLQDIGGSIQAVSGDDLAAKAGLGFNDYMRQVPGLSANNSGAGQTQITMRGVASTRLNHANPNIPSTSSVYFGETNVTASGFNPDAGLIDIERVEVLRGPQGTLFGASSMSGAIRVIPKEPELDEFLVHGKFSAFSTRGGAASQNGDITVNIPLSDSFAIRSTAYNIHNGGYIDNIYSGPANSGREDYNSEDIFGLRVSALYENSDNFRAKFIQVYQESHANGRPDEYLTEDPLTGFGVNSGGSILMPGENITITDELQVAKFVDETFDDKLEVSSLVLEWNTGDLNITSATSYMSREFENLLDDTYRSRDWVSVANENWWDIDQDGSGIFSPGTGVAGILSVGADPLDPANSVPVTRSPFVNDTQLSRVSQELRVSSDYDNGFNFIAGLYYEDESRDFQQDITIPGLDIWLDNFSTYITTPAFGATLADSFFEGRYSFDTTQTALFGEVSYEVGPWEFIAGGRYFDYSQDGDVFFGGFIEFSEDRLQETIDESGFNPKAEVVYAINDDITAYALYSEGFRLGSVQQFINESACAASLEGIGLDSAPTSIDSDSLENREIGIKTSLFGGRTTLNATYYQIDWDNARSQVFLGCGWIVEFNAIDIESSGLELSLNSRITDDLSMSFNLGTNDSRVSGVAPAATMVAQVGDRTPMTPDLTYSLGFDYVRPSTFNNLDLIIRGDVSYTDDQVSSLGTAAEQANGGLVQNLEVPDNTVGNIYLGVGNEDWEATFFVKNFTDERIVTGIDIDRRGPAAYSIARPMSVGFSIRFFR